VSDVRRVWSQHWPWKKSTLWRRTMPGFPAGWVTVMCDEHGAYSWEVLLVDVAEPEYGAAVNLTAAKRAALAKYEAMGEALHRARGGQ
jgi:hypothetical protein